VIVNVQIKGLIYDKPRSGGAQAWAGYGKSIRCEKVNVFFFFESKQRWHKKLKFKSKINIVNEKLRKRDRKCGFKKRQKTSERQETKVGEVDLEKDAQISKVFTFLKNYKLNMNIDCISTFERYRSKIYKWVETRYKNLFERSRNIGVKYKEKLTYLHKHKTTSNLSVIVSEQTNQRINEKCKLFGFSVACCEVIINNIRKCIERTKQLNTETVLNYIKMSYLCDVNKILCNMYCNKNIIISNVCKIKKVLNLIKMYYLLVINKFRNKNIIFLNACKLQFQTIRVGRITNNDKVMTLILILLILFRSGIELNPGPPRGTKIVTYNCNGLGDQSKLRRLLTKVNKDVENGAIILLQETHIVNSDYLKTIWKNKFISNCKKTNAAGVIILFNNQYEVKCSYLDNDGRVIVAVITNEERTIIVANAYFPNDHKIGIAFAENLYLKIVEAQNEYPENITICAGDFNTCMSEDDSMGRKESKNEKLLADVIRGNNKVAKLSDSYRSVYKNGGYTWKRGTTYSRLDYVFISNTLLQQITKAETDWAFEVSDHAAVKLEILTQEPERGPGIKKVNANILEDKNSTEKIGAEIEEMMKQTDKNWNPHMTLEFMKMTIRTIFAQNVSEVRKKTNEEVKEKEEELNQFENLKIKVYQKLNLPENEQQRRIEAIDNAITTLKQNLSNLRKNMLEKMSFASKAKWFEKGEKSNKFFLNLNKIKQSQKTINQMRNGDELYTGQEEVTKGITKFYKELYKEEITKKIDEDNFYENCPKISDEQMRDLDKELTLKELKEALVTCSESAPGPDGIPYSVYKKYWNIVGPVILAAWKHSLEIEKLPPSHLESLITLLPKEGKDNKEIKNWRPITLSNCDAKIITKALSLRTARVLESIIDTSQTAYVPGRSITDNLRTNFYFKNFCQKNNKDAVSISLDAKKAFDSVSHKYIEETLEQYGFGPNFLKSFKTLYKDITARILINGWFSEAIRIERGVKQGDALSCASFIICIDPLLRNINKNKHIKEVQISRRNITNKRIIFKGAAYADDISVICERKSIQLVFNEYDRLTSRSGLELNADKTEILKLNSKESESFNITYNEKRFQISTVDTIKICGLCYCCDMEKEYQLNVHEKIMKLTHKIKAWSHRHLTMEGKVLIIKTFGLSQLIYNMQAYGFDRNELTTIERTIFKFLWSSNEVQNGIDRIKRSIMKNEYSKGGMKVTDVESLNSSLKLNNL